MDPALSIDNIIEYVSFGVKYLITALGMICFMSGFNATYTSGFLILLIILVLCDLNERHKLPQAEDMWTSINDDDIALITGGSRGLGLEIVKQLIDHNVHKILILDVIEPEISNERIEFHKCDIGDEVSLKLSINELINKLNYDNRNISILINNAGIRHNESILNLPDDKIHTIFNVNSFSHIWILKAVLNNHIDHILPKNSNKKLFIVSISSILGTLAPKNLSIYSASKSIIIRIHEALTQEISQFQTIRLLLVTTGQLTTAMFQDAKLSKQFFAPVVDHVKLAKKITYRINRGEKGVLCDPFYANFLPIVSALPISLQEFCRKFSEMDDKIKDN